MAAKAKEPEVTCYLCKRTFQKHIPVLILVAAAGGIAMGVR